ncbi:hypothetical protein [Occallatibacter riparius]|uniref:Uncharacterized protein n=1 Tax=Occallatibacter riparius TaxID=1002689 RepID=A0A9J7BVQ1_9BACT|nr:hypothetical protein [Occallatibacter riparius]UWZ86609.1 hypothetical protein MOP44_11845 [Occallatibacter riparius]
MRLACRPAPAGEGKSIVKLRFTRSALAAAIISLSAMSAGAQVPEPNQSMPAPQPERAYQVRLHHDVPMKNDSGPLINPRSPISPGPSGAHLTYYGGPVVSNIKVVVVYYGSGSYLPALSTGLPNFYSALTNGTYMDMLSEYSTQGVSGGGTTGNQIIARGGSNAFLGSYTITPSAANNGSTISDAQIQSELQAQINASHLPAPDYDASGNADTLYMIYFPAGKTITQGGSSSCVSGGFCAYHGTISSAGRNLLYGVQPDMQSGSGCYTGCGNSATGFNNYTSVASHEFAETITDAAVGLATTTAPPLAWYDNTNGEVGDICNAIQGTADGYTVQAEWSNLQNGCALGPVSFTVTTPASATAGSAFSITVQTKNSAGANMSSYRGKIHFTSTDGSAVLPADYTFTSTDAGAHTFSGVVLNTSGSQTITATGTINVGFKGTSSAVSVSGGTTSNDFSISASPSSMSVAAGSAGSSTISTAVTSGSAGTVSLAVSGAPSGVTASLSPTSVTAGSSSTLSISTTSAAVAGTYTLTVTGTEGSATHSTTVSLTITSSGGGGSGITNGGFETGTTSGWTVSGASTSVVSSGCHSGTYCARAGSTSPTNGDSSLAQTFTAPTGATGISFWYKMTCPDTVTYDWATASLKDNTAGTTATLLSKVCQTNSSWVNITGVLTAGHSYTLTLTSHDDNYSGDATYTLFDDVATTNTVVTGGITNGGFETGTSSGWTVSGASTSIANSGCHGGTYCARAGSTAATNGDSTFAQTFTVPTGKSQLSLWYKETCPDTVTYDWAVITLKNNATSTTSTILAKTCSTTAWVNKTIAVTAGTSYTLTMTSHDDNYSGDPTVTLFDDVGLN